MNIAGETHENIVHQQQEDVCFNPYSDSSPRTRQIWRFRNLK